MGTEAAEPADMVWETGPVDTESIRRLVQRGMAGFVDPRTWRAASYVLVSVFIHLGLFVAALVLLAVTLPFAVIGVGIPLVVAALTTIDRLVGQHLLIGDVRIAI